MVDPILGGGAPIWTNKTRGFQLLHGEASFTNLYQNLSNNTCFLTPSLHQHIIQITSDLEFGSVVYRFRLTNNRNAYEIIYNSLVNKSYVLLFCFSFFLNKTIQKSSNTTWKQHGNTSPTGLHGAPAKRCGATLAVE